MPALKIYFAGFLSDLKLLEAVTNLRIDTNIFIAEAGVLSVLQNFEPFRMRLRKEPPVGSALTSFLSGATVQGNSSHPAVAKITFSPGTLGLNVTLRYEFKCSRPPPRSKWRAPPAKNAGKAGSALRPLYTKGLGHCEAEPSRHEDVGSVPTHFENVARSSRVRKASVLRRVRTRNSSKTNT